MAGISRRNYSADDPSMQGTGDLSKSGYYEYPPAQPFIHDDYRRDVSKPIIAYPESNRQGVMSALKNLQERIKQIELEKKQAERSLHSLKTDPLPARVVPSANVTEGTLGDTTRASDIHGRLLAQEERCRALERQLERTRLMVQQAEHDRAEALRKMAQLRADNQQIESVERRAYAEKIAELEREQFRLTATQALAQNKIQDLEQKLEDEREYRFSLEADPQEEVESIEPEPVTEKPTKPRRKKKRSVSGARTYMKPARGAVGRKYPGTSKLPGSEPPEHYRLNLAEIPFLTGKNTGRSHSLSANFQEVLSLMKSHNSKLCSGPQQHLHVSPRCARLRTVHYTPSTAPNGNADPDDVGSPTGPADELTELIVQLEQEFGQMSVEHDDLKRQVDEACDQRLRDDLERELDGLVSRMETKGEQIIKLKHCQESLMKSSTTRKSRSHGKTSSTTARLPVSSSSGEVLITTTVCTKGKGSMVRPASSSCSRAQGSLNLLKDLKKIQTTLRADDIQWDC